MDEYLQIISSSKNYFIFKYISKNEISIIMKPFLISLINSIILISMGSWSYLANESHPITALIPVFVGLCLLLLNKKVKNEDKLGAHLAVLITLLIIIGLLKPLMGSFGKENYPAIFRIILMEVTSILALFSFIKSFIEVRKNRKNK